MMFNVSFDNSALTLNAITLEEKFSSFTTTNITTANSAGNISFAYAGVNNLEGNGKIATLSFTINKDASDGACPVVISIPNQNAFYYDSGSTVSLSLASINGEVTIIAPQPGDIDCNGEINLADALYVINALLNGAPCEDADMNNDGKITLVDILRIFKILHT